MNGNDTKMNNTQCSTVASPTKRASLRTRIHQQCTTETNSGSQVNHKRPSTLDSSINKRLKSNSTVSSFNLDNSSSTTNGKIQPQSFPLQSQNGSTHQKSSHLLQHLMAPSPERVRKYTGPATKPLPTGGKLSTDTQWTTNVGYDKIKPESDSVLKNLLQDLVGADVPMCAINQVKENNLNMNMSQVALEFDNNRMDSDSSGIESDDYGLVDDIFLVNDLNSGFPKSVGDSSQFSSSADDLLELMKSAVDERKPFESFEKQITVTVPQPPPLKPDAFSIGGGLFDGITDHTNILPASLISPMGTESNYDYNMFDRADGDSLLDCWADEMK